MSGPLSIGLAQLAARGVDGALGRRRSLAAAREAFESGADVVVLPELVVPGYDLSRDALEAAAEPVDGPTVRAWTALADEYGGLVCGGFCERDGDAIHNSAVVVGGDVLLHYRKLHLFAEEKLVFGPGDRGLPVADTPFGRIGVCVCYDLRFVETARILALQGADLICVPTAWTAGFDDRAWDADGMAPQAHGAILQANLNQVFIACASQAGRSGAVRFLGSSVLADPLGGRLAGPLSHDHDEVVVIDVDLAAAQRAQVRGPLITPRADRRTDVYGLLVGDERL
jgi:N-carbamoylputrescine amidase